MVLIISESRNSMVSGLGPHIDWHRLRHWTQSDRLNRGSDINQHFSEYSPADLELLKTRQWSQLRPETIAKVTEATMQRWTTAEYSSAHRKNKVLIQLARPLFTEGVSLEIWIKSLAYMTPQRLRSVLDKLPIDYLMNIATFLMEGEGRAKGRQFIGKALVECLVARRQFELERDIVDLGLLFEYCERGLVSREMLNEIHTFRFLIQTRDDLDRESMRVLSSPGSSLSNGLVCLRPEEIPSVDDRNRIFWRTVNSLSSAQYARLHRPMRSVDGEEFTCATCDEPCSYEDAGNGEYCSCEESCCKTCMKTAIQFSPDGMCPYKCGAPLFGADLARLGVDEKSSKDFFRAAGKKELLTRKDWVACKSPNCSGGALRPEVISSTKMISVVACGLCKSEIKLINPLAGDKAMAKLLLKGLTQTNNSILRECYYCGSATQRISGCDSMNCATCKGRWNFVHGNSGNSVHSGQAQHYIPHKGLLRDLGFYKGLIAGGCSERVVNIIERNKGMTAEAWLNQCLTQAQEKLEQS